MFPILFLPGGRFVLRHQIKRSRVSKGVCKKHLQRETWLGFFIMLAVLGGILLAIVCFGQEHYLLGIAATLIALIALGAAVVDSFKLRATKIEDNGRTWIRGAHADYLNSLPAVGTPGVGPELPSDVKDEDVSADRRS